MTPRVSLVTGASSGIGLAVVRRLAARGDHLTLVARGVEALERTAEEARAAGAASVHIAPTDVGDDDAVAECVRGTLARHGRIDDVVCSAGVVSYGRTEEVPPEVFEGVLRTNVLGVVNVVRHVLPPMRARGLGSIVVVSSVVGHLTVPTMTPYVMSKWAVRALCRQLQVENRDVGVSVSCVSPGGVDTPIYPHAANYTGNAGTPPPPVLSPDAVARVIVRRLERPRRNTQVPMLNHVLRLGFVATPRVYDRLIGPLFARLATDADRTVRATAGNVLSSLQKVDHR
ncbi:MULTISPECIES: SDR family NAD(P)-dependent oxidoreductase [Aeromicrobium]|uniref:SDR family oxidoreductase n=1 Tax=Aeromicrobium phoceense TaxID=2754045 RepID=A0A838XGU7_9ACTN|nr:MULTISPECIES: SDR family oxidoreductase [Aeromicrobium]MBA4608181.1 SDR family oxidoreductase [Aeromicrobium phoceense]